MGKIIVITGIDGSGKETQTRELVKFLSGKGYKVKMQSFPCYDSQSSGPVKMYLGGEISETANEIGAYQASTLFAVDRFCTMKKYNSFLKSGGIVLLDRYLESNIIHQSGKLNNEAEKQDFMYWLENFEFNILKIPKPDLTIYLDMPLKTSLELAHKRLTLKNGEKKDLHEQDKNHLKNAHEMCQTLYKKFNWAKVNCVDDKNNLRDIQSIHEDVKKIALKFLNQSQIKEFSK